MSRLLVNDLYNFLRFGSCDCMKLCCIVFCNVVFHVVDGRVDDLFSLLYFFIFVKGGRLVLKELQVE